MSGMDRQARVVQRVLSPARAATRDKLIAAAIELATEGGYEAVTVRAVAAAAGTSVPTAYQHVSSKDELLVEALMTLGDKSSRQLQQRPPSGRTAADRISSAFAQIMRAAHEKPLLYQALYRAWVASAPSVAGLDGTPGFGPGRATWIGRTLEGDGTEGHTREDLDAAWRILSCLFLGALIEVASGRDLDDIVQLLSDAAHRLLPEPATTTHDRASD